MGDGINRILSIVLAAVNADNGVLLIDEFENGLHHSVQQQLWEVIFKLSELLNIQVFVTTHSNDCISGFEEVLNQESGASGKLIRLERKTAGIRTVEFDSKELEIATDNNIETR
jgi:AAA15 family ATPase/GTPase